MTLIEKISRALCWSNGMNPDITLGGNGVNFLWMEYEHQAQAVIDSVGLTELIDACQKAYTSNGYEYMWLREKLGSALAKVSAPTSPYDTPEP